MQFPTNIGIKNSTDEQHKYLMLSYNSAVGVGDTSLLLDKINIISNDGEE
jgi:hypothetical protein